MSIQETTAALQPAPPDQRPPCPAGFPERYVITWWEWKYSDWSRSWGWCDRVSMFPFNSHRNAIEEAANLQAQGHRVVSIVTIPAVK